MNVRDFENSTVDHHFDETAGEYIIHITVAVPKEMTHSRDEAPGPILDAAIGSIMKRIEEQGREALQTYIDDKVELSAESRITNPFVS